MRFQKAFISVLAFILFIGCSSEEKKTDLAQEMAAQQSIMKLRILVKQGKMGVASDKLAKLEKLYGHTETYKKEKHNLLSIGLSTVSPSIALTGRKLIELENTLIDYHKNTGQWPDAGIIMKPLDAWNNELYWIVAEPEKVYDLLVISAGLDGEPGSGDELLIVWIDNDKKQPGALKKSGKGMGSKKKGKSIKSESLVMSLDDLMKLETESGQPADRKMTLKLFAATGRASKKSGPTPERGDGHVFG